VQLTGQKISLNLLSPDGFAFFNGVTMSHYIILSGGKENVPFM
jgi:hypothetical protein